MKTPGDISGKEIIKALKVFGYNTVRQNGSHIRVTSFINGEHHLAIPNHHPIKTGTLNGHNFTSCPTFSINKRRSSDEII